MAKTARQPVDEDLAPRTPQEIESLLDRVQSLLDQAFKKKKIGFRLKVADRVQVDNWLNIIVVPTGKDARAYEYAKALTDIDHQLWDAGISNVLLVPALPD